MKIDDVLEERLAGIKMFLLGCLVCLASFISSVAIRRAEATILALAPAIVLVLRLVGLECAYRKNAVGVVVAEVAAWLCAGLSFDCCRQVDLLPPLSCGWWVGLACSFVLLGPLVAIGFGGHKKPSGGLRIVRGGRSHQISLRIPTGSRGGLER